MSSQLFQKLEEKVDQTLEIIELFRLQIEEYEDKLSRLMNENNILMNENAALKHRQAQWEQGLSSILHKLTDAHFNTELPDTFQPAIETQIDADVEEDIMAE